MISKKAIETNIKVEILALKKMYCVTIFVSFIMEVGGNDACKKHFAMC